MPKVAIIKPGETFVLPKGAIIDSIIETDGGIAVSACYLPPTSSYKCGYFYLILDNDDNNHHSMDERLTVIKELKVGSITYNINEHVIINGDNPGDLQSISTLNSHVPDQGVISFKAINRQLGDKRQLIYLYIKAPGGMWDDIWLILDNRGSIQYYKPIEHTCDDYTPPEL